MKTFFRLVGLVFVLFATLVAVGASQPGVETIERSRLIDADVEDVYQTLIDLREWREWSHLVPDTDAIVFDVPAGTGANAAWSTEAGAGSVEILQTSQDVLVLADVRSRGEARILTYALAPDGGRTMVLLKQERDLGGFPYLKRLRSGIVEGDARTGMDASLARLGNALEGRDIRD